MNERIYLEPGLSLHTLCGDELRFFARLRDIFGVQPVARENWIEFSGEAEAVGKAMRLLEQLRKLYLFRGKTLEHQDLDLLFRSAENGFTDLNSLWQGRVAVSPKKRDVMPRSARQLQYLAAMRDREVVFGIGPAGTGKTYLAMAMAVSMFLRGEVSRIVLTRPARESGERLGFLPGSLEEKVSPYLRPLYDALYEMLSVDEARDLIERGVVEVAPLAFMRGRTLNNSFIILDEAQNTTEEQMLMFLTRMGFGSRCVVTGDPTQSDLAPHERSGLKRAVDALKKIPEIGMVFFETSDVVRHALLERIINAYSGGKREG